MAGITCDDKGLTPEDFFRLIVRTDGAGNYALAINDVGPIAGWEAATSCPDGLTWQDILMLVLDKTKNAVNIVDAT